MCGSIEVVHGQVRAQPGDECRNGAQQTIRRPLSLEVVADALNATVRLSTDRCFPGQELAVALTIQVRPGWHVYGRQGSFPPER